MKQDGWLENRMHEAEWEYKLGIPLAGVVSISSESIAIDMKYEEIITITEDNGKVYIHITDAKPIKIHGTRFLLFKYIDRSSAQVKSTALAMTSIVEINFTGAMV